MKLAHAVVGGWAAGNVVLALILLAFNPAPLPFLLYIGASSLVAGFGVAVLLALRANRVGAQQRQPRHAGAALFTALGLAVGLTGFVYTWGLWVLALYPLILTLWLVRGERLRHGARPWPAALDGADPAGPPRFVHRGSALGVSTAVPADHAAHGPPAPPSRWPRRLREVVLLAIGARAAVEALRRWRR